MIDVVQLILLIVGTGALSYEVVFSDLAYNIKRLFWLHQEQPVLQLVSSLKAYKKVLGLKLTCFLFPLILVVMAFAISHRFVFKLLSCPFCTSFQLGFWLALIAFNQPLVLALLIAGCSLMATALYNLIRSASI